MDNRTIALSMYSEAYLNKPKLTRSDGRKMLAIARSNRPAESTASRRTKPHSTPIRTPAEPMDRAAMMLEMAMATRVAMNPYVEGKVGMGAAWEASEKRSENGRIWVG